VKVALETGEGDGHNVAGHGAYADEVQIAGVEHTPPIGKGPLGTPPGPVLRQSIGIYLGDGDEAQAGVCGYLPKVVLRVTAAADNGDLEICHGLLCLRRWTAKIPGNAALHHSIGGLTRD